MHLFTRCRPDCLGLVSRCRVPLGWLCLTLLLALGFPHVAGGEHVNVDFHNGGWARESVSGERPNLVLVLVDDLGKEWISYLGAEEIETARLDAMARQGMVLNNVYSMPQCTPSRVALLTGQYPYRNGWVNHWDVPRWGAGCHFDPSMYPVVLGRAMQRAGYKTAVAGKWQIDDFRVEPNALAEAGFDDWCVWTGGEGGNPVSDQRYWDPYIAERGKITGIRNGVFGPDVYNQFVLDFISEREAAGEAYFVYYPMVLVHTPFVTTPLEPQASGRFAKHQAMVRYMDMLVGKLVDHIRAQRSDRKTIVIWTTDNGTVGSITGKMNGRNVVGGKSLTTENGVNSPTICWGPGLVPAGESSNALVDFTDFLPTFLELGGTSELASYDSAPSMDQRRLDGVSFAQVLLGQAKTSGRPWILAMGGGNDAAVTEAGVENKWIFRDRVFRNRRYKVFVGTDRRPSKLIDLLEDPAERVNLLGGNNAEANSFLRVVDEAVSEMPARDRDPIYNPNPEQPWDRKVREPSQVWKSGK